MEDGTILAIKRVREMEYAYIGEPDFFMTHMAKQGVCDVAISDERFKQSTQAFATYKGFPYSNMFNKR